MQPKNAANQTNTQRSGYETPRPQTTFTIRRYLIVMVWFVLGLIDLYAEWCCLVALGGDTADRNDHKFVMVAIMGSLVFLVFLPLWSLATAGGKAPRATDASMDRQD